MYYETEHKLYGKFVNDPKIDTEAKKKGFSPIPKTLNLKCSCGFDIDLTGLKNDIELKIGRKVLL